MSIFRRASDTIFKNKNPNGQLTVDRDYIMLDIGDPTITRSAQIGTIIRFSKLPKLNGIRSKKKRSDVLDYKTRQCMYIFDRKDDNTQNDDNEDFDIDEDVNKKRKSRGSKRSSHRGSPDMDSEALEPKVLVRTNSSNGLASRFSKVFRSNSGSGGVVNEGEEEFLMHSSAEDASEQTAWLNKTAALEEISKFVSTWNRRSKTAFTKKSIGCLGMMIKRNLFSSKYAPRAVRPYRRGYVEMIDVAESQWHWLHRHWIYQITEHLVRRCARLMNSKKLKKPANYQRVHDLRNFFNERFIDRFLEIGGSQSKLERTIISKLTVLMYKTFFMLRAHIQKIILLEINGFVHSEMHQAQNTAGTHIETLVLILERVLSIEIQHLDGDISRHCNRRRSSMANDIQGFPKSLKAQRKRLTDPGFVLTLNERHVNPRLSMDYGGVMHEGSDAEASEEEEDSDENPIKSEINNNKDDKCTLTEEQIEFIHKDIKEQRMDPDRFLQFFMQTTLPLLRPSVELLSRYWQPLMAMTVECCQKQPNLICHVLAQLLRIWPRTDTYKQELFLMMLEALFELLTKRSDHVDISLMGGNEIPLFKRLSEAISSPHYEVSEKALKLFDNYPPMFNLTFSGPGELEHILPMVYRALVTTLQIHPFDSVRFITAALINYLEKANDATKQVCDRIWAEINNKTPAGGSKPQKKSMSDKAVARVQRSNAWSHLEGKFCITDPEPAPIRLAELTLSEDGSTGTQPSGDKPGWRGAPDSPMALLESQKASGGKPGWMTNRWSSGDVANGTAESGNVSPSSKSSVPESPSYSSTASSRSGYPAASPMGGITESRFEDDEESDTHSDTDTDASEERAVPAPASIRHK